MIFSKVLSSRKNISIIPQNPILFSGTIRKNIDPENNHSDNTLQDVMTKIGLRDFASNLNLAIQDNGSNFSSGQKQLICLARAAIKKSKILVLDEATANMDADTDRMLHEYIAEIFSDCTVLAVTHRLHTILNCDKVLVLDNGRIVEFDSPKVLLDNKGSYFYKMSKENSI